MITTTRSVVAVLSCLLASGCIVSDPELSDLAVSRSGSDVYVVVALCPKEEVASGVATWDGGGAALVPSGDPGGAGWTRLTVDHESAAEKIRGRFEVELDLVDEQGRSRLLGSFWSRSELMGATDGYLLDDVTTVEPDDLVAREC